MHSNWKHLVLKEYVCVPNKIAVMVFDWDKPFTSRIHSHSNTNNKLNIFGGFIIKDIIWIILDHWMNTSNAIYWSTKIEIEVTNQPVNQVIIY